MRDIIERLEKENVIDTDGLDVEPIRHLCRSAHAYRLGRSKLVSQKHLKNLVLQDVKKHGKPTFLITVCDRDISKDLIDVLLISLHNDGLLIITDNDEYRINFEGCISEKVVRDICEYRSDTFKCSDILQELNFFPFIPIPYTEGGYGSPAYPYALKQCKITLLALVQKGELIQHKPYNETFSWNFWQLNGVKKR